MEVTKDLLECLDKKFGFLNFRDGQWKIISSIINDERDNLVVAATGYGKSLCYQFPSVYLKTITMVVTPLILQMQEQVKELCDKDIQACFLGSAQENKNIEADIIHQKYTIVYATPEYITSEKGTHLLEAISEHLSLIAVDNAHFISRWGNGFRKEYANLYKLREICPLVPILAMTATATERVRNDIIESLKLNDPQIIRMSIDRPNLEISILEKKKLDDIWSHIGPCIEEFKGQSIIIYCVTRGITESVSKALKGQGLECDFYHGKMELKDREKVRDDFFNKRIRAVIATPAFGLGLNDPNISLVIHYGMPLYLETYYHQIGCAGRDGLPAKCVMFYNIAADWYINSNVLEHYTDMSDVEIQKNRETMCKYIETTECRRRYLLSYFDEVCCDNCRIRRAAMDIE